MFCCAVTILTTLILTIIIAPFLLLWRIINSAAGKSGGDESITTAHSIHWKSQIDDEQDGIETARNMFSFDPSVEIIGGDYKTVDKTEFDRLNVQNHRADVNATTIDEIFPPEDRPRGEADISSIKYFMESGNDVDPIMVLKYDNELYVIDGVHRLVAAYLLNCPIKYREYTVSTH